MREWRRKRRRDDPTAEMWAAARQRARKSGVPFTITREDVKAVWPIDNRCPVLGIEFKRGKNSAALPSSPTLDRLNPQWGYEKGNIAVISYHANRAKGGLSASELERIVRWMRSQGLD